VTLHHRLEGPADAPVVVLSSSIGTTMAMWDPQREALAAEWRLLRYDHPGHGGSPPPPGALTMADLTRQVLALLDELGLQRVSWCGLSLGGMVGQWLAVHAPGRLDRLVLCCTTAGFRDPGTWEERAATVRAGGTAALADRAMERWFTTGFREREPEAVARCRAMLVEQSSPEGYAACIEAIRDFDLHDRLGSIRAPTLVVAGDEDPSTPVAHARALVAGIPGARLEVVPAAHLANIEQPDAVTRAIAAHLGGQTVGSPA
jgi:3-oxoadipate enol-lactonase